MTMLEAIDDRPLNVLYVDDDYEDCLLTQSMLHSCKRNTYNVTWADGLKSGMERLQKTPPDVCLVDFSLGEHTGLEFVQWAKETGFPGPVILITGRSDPDLDQLAMAAGAIDYLEKNSINAGMLTRAIRYGIHQKRVERELSQLASNDHLTGLSNRASFDERLKKATATCQRTGKPFGLLLLDIDHFKQINDSLGHHAGDALLIEVGERLRQCCREDDAVSRWGGDEFAIIAGSIGSALGAAHMANRIVLSMSQPFHHEGSTIRTSASVGIVYCDASLAGRPELLSFADQALYQAKAAGRNGCAFFDEDMNTTLRRRLFVRDQLDEALSGRKMGFHGQVIVQADNGDLAGVELLARLSTADGTSIPPDEFVAAAEESSAIWTLTQAAMATVSDWRHGLLAAAPMDARVSVNISPKQFNRADAASMIIELAERAGARPEWIDLEITENAVMADIERTRSTLARLADAGFTISLDDFGAGRTSLSHLAQLPIQRLKIDRGFVSQAATSPQTRAICEGILALAGRLGIETLAEGVETPEQSHIFRDAGCDLMQGFLYGSPQAAQLMESAERLSIAS